MEKEKPENGKNDNPSQRPQGQDIWNLFGKPIPMKWIALFVICFLIAYTYVRLKNL
jgi:hypothetical protein